MEETIYVVDDDDEEEEAVKVCKKQTVTGELQSLKDCTDYQEAVGDAVCQGSVLVHESTLMLLN